MDRVERKRPGGWRRLVVAGATALACAGLATAAGAQGTLPGGIEPPPLPKEATDALSTVTEPAPYLKQQTGQDLDTDYTPIAKESKLWSLHQGARYVSDNEGGAETRAEYEARFAASQNSAAEQVTTWDDELTDVAFSNTRNGFAGGQRKLDCVAADGSPGTDGVPDTYVPVIYRYGDSSTGLRWLKPTAEKGGLLGDCSNPGFVGQITWIRTTGMALAVGGDGSYPYRAPAFGKDVNGNPCPYDPNKPFGANCDQAGLGRAWLYNHGAWQELDHDLNGFRNEPDPADPEWGETIHGMTALEFSPLPGRDFGFAGALGQLRPFTVAVEGQNGACEATDANECVSFPNDGKLAVLGAGVKGRFDMDEHGEDPIPADGETLPDTTDATKFPLGGCTSSGINTNNNRACKGDTDNAFRFRFRVRQIRMSSTNAVAVTDGCCAGDVDASDASGNGVQFGPVGNYPSVLFFQQLSKRSASLSWAIGAPKALGGEGWRWQLWSSDHYAQQYERSAYYGLPEAQRRQVAPPNLRQDWPDSFYSISGGSNRFSVIASPGGPPPTEGVPERPSLVSEPICSEGDLISDGTSSESSAYTWGSPNLAQPSPVFTALRAQLAGVRLVDGDGDELVAFAGFVGTTTLGPPTVGSPPLAGAPSNAQRVNPIPGGCRPESRARKDDGSAPPGDLVPDWAVGELYSTHQPGLGARGLAFSTVSRPTLTPDVLDLGWTGDEPRIAGDITPPPPDPARVLATLADPVNNPPTTQEKLVAYLQSQYFFTGSYALNALDYIDGAGYGWAIGMHGGIVGPDKDSLASKARVEPEPPPLGAKQPGRAPERTPYEPFDPPVAEPSAVPSLATRPLDYLDEHAIQPAGAPNAAGDYANRFNALGQIVLSRDGSEGWGLDGSTNVSGLWATTFFHYQGGAWSRCDPEGIDEVITPDPACAALAPLRAYSVEGKTRGVAVAAAARIPYENDDDAANDDEFEVFAIGSGYRDFITEPAGSYPEDTPGLPQVYPTLLRYREGAWRFEDDRPTRRFFHSNAVFNGRVDRGQFASKLSTAFAAPDDGWLLISGGLLHFDGERWISCFTPLDGDPYMTADVRFSDGPEISNSPEERKRWCDDENQLTITATAKEAGSGANIPFAGGQDTQDIDSFIGLATAGSRLYLYGYRTVGGQNPLRYPLLLCKDAGEDWRSAGCGLDPGLEIRKGRASGGLQGQVNALSVAVGEDRGYRGWAAGSFGGEAGRSSSVNGVDVENSGLASAPPIETALLRLTGSAWHPYTDDGPIRDGYASDSRIRGLNVDTKIVALPDGGGLISGNGTARFETDIGRWRAFTGSARANLAAVPDNRGGAWLAGGSDTRADLLHYTNRPPKPVFSEAPSPLPRKEESFTGLAGQSNGSLWASTSDGYLYRYARSTGWDRVPIPGWRAKRATVAPAAYAVAVNDSGTGVAVGREGRIADLAGSEVRLNPAAGTLCDLANVVPPCGSSRHLRATAVAPDGAAITGGEQLALLWRPAGGHFRAIEKPEAAPSAEVTGLSLPAANVAYLTTNVGQLFRGDFDGAKWSWQIEGTDASGNLLTADPTGARAPAALRAVAVDPSGHGYAVGERGVLLERVGGEGCGGEGVEPCWRMVRSGASYDLTAVALRGENVLVGGEDGLVLTGGGGQLAVARPGDPGSNFTGDVIGLALAGGVQAGQVEAWAATNGRNTPSGSSVSQLFHYASEGSEPLLNPALARANPLSDSPDARDGEVSFAAFGKLDCHREHRLCEGLGANAEYAALSRRSVEEIAQRAKAPAGPALTVFTGDATDDAGVAATGTVDSVSPPQQVRFQIGHANLNGLTKLQGARRWLAEPLARGGLPFFSAVGSQDLASSQVCPSVDAGGGCLPTQELARPGVNDVWRQAFATEPAPWGKGKRFSSERYEVRPLSRSGSELAIEDPKLEAGGAEPKLPLGGARTHYAFDLVERETGKKLARFAFADNSLRSLQASDPFQYPLELETNESGTGQAGWLRRVLCVKGSGSRCSREPNQPAVVVANAPTYSNTVEDPRFLAKDVAVFESLLLQNKATAVIAGSLGWNGRYWATAPGLHEPCPGEPYRESPPKPGTSSCRGRSTEELPLGASGVAPVARQLGSALGPAEPVIDQVQGEVSAVAGEGLLPFVVASGAGGKLAGQGASDGFFHGYSIVRVPGNADPAGVLVEQRPLYEFLSLTAASHVLRPGQKMTLRGVGRGPLAYDSSTEGLRTTSFDTIDSAAIGHRYDLIEADPQRPWLPKAPYVPLDPSVATIDSETGVIAVGKGNNPRTFALGMLSVGCSGTQAGADGACDPDDPGVHVATFPLLFESRRTFKPPVPPVPPVAQLRTQAQAVLPQPPNPPQPPNVQNAPLPPPPNVPVPPAPQVLEVNAPVPPIPPPPPLQQSPVPLDLTASAPTLQIAPQTTVIPPPAPPIQPAPPGGARREARQRQSATQSSGSGSGANEGHEGLSDLAEGPNSPSGSQQMTRIDRVRAEGGSVTLRQPGEDRAGHSFTAVRRAEQPSDWARGALYGGGVTLMALALALGWSHGRPDPRRRSPVEPAPAWARYRRR